MAIHKIKFFAGRGSRYLAEKIVASYGTKLGESEVLNFSDGEFQPCFLESIRGCTVFVIQSTFPPTDNLMELLMMIDAAKRASAHQVIAVMPYFGWARQDRKDRPRVSIGAKLVANLLTAAGVDRVLTMDLHAAQIQGFFDIPVDEMQALPLLIKYFRKKKVQDLCVVSPDHGGATRARKMSEAFDCPIAIIDKRRPKPNVAEVMGIIGNVEGKNCILVDDMIDTAGTITAGVDMLKQKGAKDVYIACTHGVLSGPAIERLSTCAAKEVVITNTIEIPQEKKFDKLVSVSVAGLLAHTIENIENDLPVSDVFTQYDC
mgnify:CR=1 FL=1